MSHNQTTNAGTTALAFNSFTFDVILRDGKQWLRVHQIGEALEYKNPDRSLTNLYNANKDEFTNSMTTVLKLDTAGGAQDVRVFSLRGAHLLGMFARTDVAKAFRRWVLDVLDREVDEQIAAAVAAMQASANDYTRINPAQAQALKELVNAEVRKTGKHHQTVWTAFQSHFEVNSYLELPAARFDEACQWLGSKRMAAKPESATSYELPAVDFDFRKELTTGQSEPKPLSSAIMALVQQISWKLAAEAQVSILQFLERFIAYRTTDATRNNVSHITRLLEPLTLNHVLAHRYFSEIGRVQQMADVVEQMAIACTQGIRRRMGTIYA